MDGLPGCGGIKKRSPPATIYDKVYLRMGVKQEVKKSE
jgi:hypothetical protein